VDARHKAVHDAFRYKARFQLLHFESDSQDDGKKKPRGSHRGVFV